MRGAPKVGFSATMRRISSRNSRLTHFLPTWFRRRESHVQYDGLRLNEDQCPLPSRPKPSKHHPEHFVGSGKLRLRVLLFQNGKLLPKGQVFQEEVAARTARLNDQIEQELQRTEHELVVAESSRISMQMAFGSFLFLTPLYPTESKRVPYRPLGPSSEGCLCLRVWRGSLDTVEVVLRMTYGGRRVVGGNPTTNRP